MRFWTMLLCGAVALSALVAATPALNGEPLPAERARSVFVWTFGLTVAMVVILRQLVRGQRENLIGASICLGVLTVSVAGWSARDHLAAAWQHLHGQMVPSLALSRAEGEVELRRAWDGHYRADARVNGRSVRMMVDTGASMVLIPFEIAAELGMGTTELDFSLPVATANGRSAVAPARIARLRIGSIELEDVEAAIAPPGRLQSPLLGMSFLERLAETTFRGDRLILRHGERDYDTFFIAAPRSN